MRFPMKKTLLVAGVFAAAGTVAQAQTFDSPRHAGEVSTMTQGAPNVVTDNMPQGRVVGHSHAIVVTHPAVVAVAPTHHGWYQQGQVHTHVMGAAPAPHGSEVFDHRGVPETSNVPLRAGEASTMTGGAPNMETNNHAGYPQTVTTVTTVGPYVYHGVPGTVYYYR